jgi:methionyl-tRNA formyltransferase
MLDAIILLTGPTEAPVLTGVLQRHNPELTVRQAVTLTDLDAIDPKVLRRARLVGFLTPVVVPTRILDRLGFGAYNFHPGPPHYPGWVPAYFAIYNRATEFGSTAHVMTERVDAGPIVDVELFPIPRHMTVQALDALALVKLAQVFWRLAKDLATRRKPLPALPIQWSGRKSTRRLYAAICDIPLDISKEDLERRIDVFGGGQFGLTPTMTLHGRTFRYIAPETDKKVESPGIVPAERMIGELA